MVAVGDDVARTVNERGSFEIAPALAVRNRSSINDFCQTTRSLVSKSVSEWQPVRKIVSVDAAAAVKEKYSRTLQAVVHVEMAVWSVHFAASLPNYHLASDQFSIHSLRSSYLDTVFFIVRRDCEWEQLQICHQAIQETYALSASHLLQNELLRHATTLHSTSFV
jgi:hypothetical protein